MSHRGRPSRPSQLGVGSRPRRFKVQLVGFLVFGFLPFFALFEIPRFRRVESKFRRPEHRTSVRPKRRRDPVAVRECRRRADGRRQDPLVAIDLLSRVVELVGEPADGVQGARHGVRMPHRPVGAGPRVSAKARIDAFPVDGERDGQGGESLVEDEAFPARRHFDVSGDVDELIPVLFYDDLQFVHPRTCENNPTAAQVAKVLQRAELRRDVCSRSRAADFDDQRDGFDKVKELARVVKILGKLFPGNQGRCEQEAKFGLQPNRIALPLRDHVLLLALAEDGEQVLAEEGRVPALFTYGAFSPSGPKHASIKGPSSTRSLVRSPRTPIPSILNPATPPKFVFAQVCLISCACVSYTSLFELNCGKSAADSMNLCFRSGWHQPSIKALDFERRTSSASEMDGWTCSATSSNRNPPFFAGAQTLPPGTTM
ncbi:hypothetical protein M885DRAFT_510353 [Pelagophyceae sp. CCMP2097]|nr:hypothetical protein M885DRAFT_510353 [Pelagophyceae sp. CCMP2097]